MEKNIKLIQKGLADREEMLLFREDGNATRITIDREAATSQLSVINIIFMSWYLNTVCI